MADQRAYFRRRFGRLDFLDLLTRRLPPLVFYASVVFAFLHFTVHLLADHFAERGQHPRADGLLVFGGACTLFAAALPVVGAGVRTLRSAFEFGRNKLRYRAAHHALTRLANRLDARRRDALDAPGLFRELSLCELILEHEHREWLRLMVEAEWYA